ARVRPDEGEAKALIFAGALASVEPDADQAVLLWKLARQRSTKAVAVQAGRSGSFFSRSVTPAPELPRGREIERLRRQFAVLGFLTDRHPIILFSDKLAGKGLVKAADLGRHVGRRVRVAGWLITGKLVSTKTDEPMEFLTFEDDTALVETTFFPGVYRRFCRMLDWGRPYILAGRVEEDFGAATMTVDQVSILS
ncbi:MAG: OB-fold nucleic acid binding domain-containing protein, partial [Pseudomonadota bacterium]